MKKTFLSLLLIIAVIQGFSQLSIQPVMPLGGMIQKPMLWNLALVNTGSGTLDCRLELSLRDRVSGIEVLTAVTSIFQLSPGAKQVNASQLMPVQYNLLSPAFTSRTDDFIPIGSYIACYRLTAGKNIVAEECISFDAEPLSPPMLINPPDSSVLPTAPAQFSWIPPAPLHLFSRLQYDLLITEILPGQKAEEAVQQNLPFYTESNIDINQLSYTNAANSFEKDKWYAWQVVARDEFAYAGKTEVWVFKVSQNTKAEIIKQTPYAQLKRDRPETAIAPDGILKISYYNETGDETAHLLIQEPGTNKNSKEISFDAKLVQGDNYIAFDLRKIMQPAENKIYTVTLTNSRHETFSLKISVKFFTNK